MQVGTILNLAPNQMREMSDQPMLMGASPDSAMQLTDAESPALTTWRAGSRRSRVGAIWNLSLDVMYPLIPNMIVPPTFLASPQIDK